MATDHASASDRIRTGWRLFRQWRKQRPFWGGVFTLLSALILLYPPYASLKFGDAVISLHTLGGVSAMVIGIVMIICAVSLWARPQFRTAAGIVTLILALVAIVTANLGSFVIGTLLGVIGAALALAWSPTPKQPKQPKRAKRARKKAGEEGSEEQDSAERDSDERDSDEWETGRIPTVPARGGDA